MWKKMALYLVLLMMIVIHTIDMEVTRHYIGNEWSHESFPLMRNCIYYFGIRNSVWISRVFMYSCFYLFLCKIDNKYLQKLLVLTTILYWVAMIPWLFKFHILEWW
jgi:hypothetical protein